MARPAPLGSDEASRAAEFNARSGTAPPRRIKTGGRRRHAWGRVAKTRHNPGAFNASTRAAGKPEDRKRAGDGVRDATCAERQARSNAVCADHRTT